MIRLERISFGYGSPIFSGLTAEFPAGAVTAVAGPNGSGKSTLLRIAAGLEAPQEGAITMDGELLAALSPVERAKRIAYLPQHPEFEGSWSVEETAALGDYPHVEAPPAPRPLPVRLDRARAALDLAEVWDRPMRSLSGGETQRAILARVFVQDTPVLVLDEPVSHLDLGRQASLFRALNGLAEEGRAVILATHDLNLSLLFGQRLLLVGKEGELTPLPDSPSERRPLLEEIYGVRLQEARVNGTTCFLPRPGTAPK